MYETIYIYGVIMWVHVCVYTYAYICVYTYIIMTPFLYSPNIIEYLLYLGTLLGT